MQKGQSEMISVIRSVIVIALFIAIMILFLTRINWTGTIDKEACHTSVLQRATFSIDSRTPFPLNCKTEKICVTDSGEDCTAYPKPTRELPVTKKEVGSSDPKQVVLDTFADALYDCHWMLGEGKVNFLPKKTWENNYCLICARVAFDDEVKEEVEDITYGEFYRHLQQKTDKDGRNYLSYIYPGWEGWQASEIMFNELQRNGNISQEMKFEDWKIDLDQENGFAVITQMQTPGRWAQYLASGTTFAVVAGASVAAVFTGGLSLALIPAAIGIGVGGGTIIGGIVYVVTTPDGSVYISPQVYPYNTQSLNSLGCNSFETAPA